MYEKVSKTVLLNGNYTIVYESINLKITFRVFPIAPFLIL